MSRTGYVDHAEIEILYDAIEMRIDEILPRSGSPVAEEDGFYVGERKRLLEKGIVEKINLADRKIIRGAPVTIDAREFIVRERHVSSIPFGLRSYAFFHICIF
jgi:hypothetical protein